MYIYIYIYIYVHITCRTRKPFERQPNGFAITQYSLRKCFKIHQRGVQWKQGVVIYTILYTSLLYHTTPIHCTSLPLHPPVMNAHDCYSPSVVQLS